MRMMKRREGSDIGNGVDSECGVGNGVDRERVDVVVDGAHKILAHDVLAFQVPGLSVNCRAQIQTGYAT